jgi:hypothetical protein
LCATATRAVICSRTANGGVSQTQPFVLDTTPFVLDKNAAVLEYLAEPHKSVKDSVFRRDQ